jgi:hypothetical protein
MTAAEALTAALVDSFLMGYMSAVVIVLLAIFARHKGRG